MIAQPAVCWRAGYPMRDSPERRRRDTSESIYGRSGRQLGLSQFQISHEFQMANFPKSLSIRISTNIFALENVLPLLVFI
jgi:hypothetical protein